MIMNIITYILKFSMNISIAVSQNFNSKTVQKTGTFCIIYFCFFRIVLRTVQFNYQLCLRAIKIDNIMIQYFLSGKGNAKGLTIGF